MPFLKNSLLLLIIFISACQQKQLGIYRMDEIPKEITVEIKNLDEELMQAIQSKSIDQVKLVATPIYQNKMDTEKLKLLFRKLGDMCKGEKHQPFSQYHLINNKNKTEYHLKESFYDILYQSDYSEEFISLIEIPSRLNSSYLIALSYALTNKEWKLNNIQAGEFTIDNKNASFFYEKAIEQLKKGHFFDAWNNINYSKRLEKPFNNNFFQYHDASKIHKTYQEAIDSIRNRYVFPLSFEKGEKVAQILDISPKNTAKGVRTVINYQSYINFNDSIALSLEFEQLRPKVLAYFHGLEEENPELIFKAWQHRSIGKSKKKTKLFYHKRNPSS